MQALEGVRDSKQMTPRQRDRLSERIREVALGWGVGSASSQEIDEIGIVPATKLAMHRALDMLMTTGNLRPDYLLLDSIKWEEVGIRQDHIVKGDMLCLSIAAASVLAKVWRDQHMREVDTHYPQYGFARHKGYGTPKHLAALREYGPCSVHRMTFAPMRLSASSTVTPA
jgi:ribonuclease HII